MSGDNETHPFIALCQELAVEYLYKDYKDLDEYERSAIGEVASKALLRNIGDELLAYRKDKESHTALKAFCAAIKPDEESDDE
jgi:hypothetical protein